MAKSGFMKNLMTGLKAMAGAVVHYIIMALILMFVAFLVGGWTSIGPGLMFLLILILLITGIIVLGWVYRTFWGWK